MLVDQYPVSVTLAYLEEAFDCGGANVSSWEGSPNLFAAGLPRKKPSSTNNHSGPMTGISEIRSHQAE